MTALEIFGLIWKMYPWLIVVWAIGMDISLTVLVAFAADSIWGSKATKIVVMTVGGPFYWPMQLITWPFKSNRNRRLWETFKVTSDKDIVLNDELARSVLTQLAKIMDWRFKNQEEARVQERDARKAYVADPKAKVNWEEASRRLEAFDRLAAEAKKEFWAAHALARRAGYFVEKSWKDYLTSNH